MRPHRAAVAVVLVVLQLFSGAAPARVLAQDAGSAADPLSNAVAPQPFSSFVQQAQSSPNNWSVVSADVVIKLAGSRFVPFSADVQRVLVQAIREVMAVRGPVELTSFKEVLPDPAAPEGLRELVPGVDLAFSMSWLEKLPIPGETAVSVSTFDQSLSDLLAKFFQWHSRCIEIGQWDDFPVPSLMNVNVQWGEMQKGYTLWPLVVVEATLGVTLSDDTSKGGEADNRLSVEQAAAVAEAVQNLVLSKSVGTLVEVGGHSLQPSPLLLNPSKAPSQAQLQLEVTLFMCRDNATVPSPECERQLLAAVLGLLERNEQGWKEVQAAGIQSVEVLGIQPRQVPCIPNNSSSGSELVRGGMLSQSREPWVPWHLDRIDQRTLPLDGKFTATGTGTGVNVYIISSGVRGDHQEFGMLDGKSGSRVRPAWGYLGLDPAQDCPDQYLWYSYGTYAASLCCGLTLGAAKNATIHSVRFRKECMSDPYIFEAGALPSALDLVLSVHTKPAVVFIDTWWSPARDLNNATRSIKQALIQRLDRLQQMDLTVIATAGISSQGDQDDICSNIIGNHPGVISVAASGAGDQSLEFGPKAWPCIDLWAPSGDVGTGLWGASAAGPSNYTRVLPRSTGAAAITVGVAAQYLELNPNATATQVREALVGGSTRGVVAGAAPGVATGLLFTNYSEDEEVPAGSTVQGQQAQLQPGGSGKQPAESGGGLDTGALVAIIVASCVAVAAGLAAGFILARRWHQMSLKDSGSTGTSAGLGNIVNSAWEVDARDVEICCRPDGREWVLGEGRYGKVYRAVKGGVQVVAVKKLQHVDPRLKPLFVKEFEMMKYVCRDANICQLYGACMGDDDIMLLMELMEGGDLRNALSSGPEFQWYRRGKEVMLDIVRGVHFLHSSRVVHQDIKSQNILLARDGRAKLADVGLAQLMDAQQQEEAGGGPTAIQAEGQSTFQGTLAWAGPEVLTGGQVTEKTDIFSLGVVLWELVTLEVPKRGCMRDPQVPEECPQKVADAIGNCMQPDPSQRPTARELYSLLLACPPTGSSQDGKSPISSSSLTNSHSLVVTVPGAPGAAVLPPSGGTSGNDGSSRGATVGCECGSGSQGSSQDCLSSGKANSSQTYSSDDKSNPMPLGSASNSTKGSSHLESILLSGETSLVSIDFDKIEFCQQDGRRVTLGKGSFGAVYKCLLDGVQPLAAKAIQLGADPGVHAAFLQEAGMLWRLRHRNLVGLSGVTISNGEGYLLMELMDGGSLFDMLNIVSKSSKQRVFSWYNRGRQVILDVARAVHYLHSLRITHFDIKSSNILLTRELTAKVADVGLARVMSCTHHSLSHDTSVGTFAYMAPELLAGTKCNQSVDIYSLGVLICEVCTGTHPAKGRMLELQVPKDCPREVADLYMRCTAADPAARPSAREVVEVLVSLDPAEKQHLPSSSAASRPLGAAAAAGAALGAPVPAMGKGGMGAAGPAAKWGGGATSVALLPGSAAKAPSFASPFQAFANRGFAPASATRVEQPTNPS